MKARAFRAEVAFCCSKGGRSRRALFASRQTIHHVKYSTTTELVAEPAVQGAPDNFTFLAGHLHSRRIERTAEKQRTATDSI